MMAAGLVTAFIAGAAWAGGEKLDEAHATTAKALALLKEASPGRPALEVHRKKAVDLLTRAQGEILKAKGE